jgi:hypothetical protein
MWDLYVGFIYGTRVDFNRYVLDINDTLDMLRHLVQISKKIWDNNRYVRISEDI